jgi:hypothetical protein
MCALQVDLKLKGLQCIMEYVSMDKVVTFVKDYD